MFDFAWSEIALIGVVALVAIGPKDLPVAMKAIAGVVKKARRMAGEFQTHVDEMMRDADLHEVREQINEIRNFDIRGEFTRAVDPDGSMRSTFSENPFEPASTTAATRAATAATMDMPSETDIATHPETVIAMPETDMPSMAAADAAVSAAPSFIPPEIANPEAIPAFLPPGTRRH